MGKLIKQQTKLKVELNLLILNYLLEIQTKIIITLHLKKSIKFFLYLKNKNFNYNINRKEVENISTKLDEFKKKAEKTLNQVWIF